MITQRWTLYYIQLSPECLPKSTKKDPSTTFIVRGSGSAMFLAFVVSEGVRFFPNYLPCLSFEALDCCMSFLVGQF